MRLRIKSAAARPTRRPAPRDSARASHARALLFSPCMTALGPVGSKRSAATAVSPVRSAAAPPMARARRQPAIVECRLPPFRCARSLLLLKVCIASSQCQSRGQLRGIHLKWGTFRRTECVHSCDETVRWSRSSAIRPRKKVARPAASAAPLYSMICAMRSASASSPLCPGSRRQILARLPAHCRQLLVPAGFLQRGSRLSVRRFRSLRRRRRAHALPRSAAVVTHHPGNVFGEVWVIGWRG